MAMGISRQLSICVATQQLGKVISGPGLHAYNLIEYLKREGHHVTVITPLRQAIDDARGYTIQPIPNPPFFNSQFRWFPISLGYAKKIRELERHQKFDLIHFTDAREALFVRSGTPLVGNVNDTYAVELQPYAYYKKYYRDWFIRRNYYRFVHACEAYIFKRFQALITNSLYTEKAVLHHYRLNPARVMTCYKSIHADKYQSIRKAGMQNKPQAARILFVGGNMQRKGLPTLIRAAKSVLASYPGVQFWVVGADPAEAGMKSLCEEHGVGDHFVFWGWKSQAELARYYQESDIFVMPSLTEAFGVVFLEAMAAGLPVIGTEVGGVPEIIQDGRNGLLIPPDQPDRLADAIVSLLANKALYARLQAGGIKTVSTFSVANMMKCTYEVYRSVLS